MGSERDNQQQDGKSLKLERNFWNWLKQAQTDFELLGSSDDMDFVTEQAIQKFSVRVNAADLMKRLGLKTATISVAAPKTHSINQNSSPKPWKR